MTKYERARVLGTRALQIRYVQSLLRLSRRQARFRMCGQTSGDGGREWGIAIPGKSVWEDALSPFHEGHPDATNPAVWH